MLEHVAVWVKDLEKMKDFYCAYFNGRTGEKYCSNSDFHAHFESYFVLFREGCRLELMQMPTIPDEGKAPGHEAIGLTHLAFSVESKAEVDRLTERAHAEGVRVMLEPHMTGDGYYEACILDPEGNRVEITVLPAA